MPLTQIPGVKQEETCSWKPRRDTSTPQTILVLQVPLPSVKALTSTTTSIYSLFFLMLQLDFKLPMSACCRDVLICHKNKVTATAILL